MKIYIYQNSINFPICRPDHNLQDLRAKIFASEKPKAIAHEEVASVSLPTRRKERSLSSLGVSTPKVSSHIVMTGKRTKSAARRLSASRESTFSVEEPIKKEEDYPENTSSPEIIHKRAQNKKNLKEVCICFCFCLSWFLSAF